MGCVASLLILAHVFPPLSRVLYAGGNLKLLLSFLFVMALTSCGNSAELDTRGIYWKKELEHQIPIGTPKAVALDHLRTLDPNASENPISGNIHSNLETIPADNPPCKEWVITGTTVIENEAVVKHLVSAVGRCL